MARPILIHIHIPKTAGTTINALLGDAIRGKHFAYSLPGHREKFEAMSQVDRDRYDFLFGHFPYGAHRFFSRPVCYIASIRKPQQRLLSFYHYILSTVDHPLHGLVKDNAHNFSEFLRLALKESRVRREIDNIQIRMIAGQMEVRDEYNEVLAKSMANITAGNFFITEMQHLSDFLPWLEQSLALKFGPVPRLNASPKGASFAEEIEHIEPDARDILERFCRWDAVLCSVVRDVTPGAFERISPAPGAVAGSQPASAVPAIPDDPLVRQFVAALYRVLLLREPDATGLANRIEQIRGGQPVEDVMRQILKSAEFAEKRNKFSHAYFGFPNQKPAEPQSSSSKLEFDLVSHQCEGRAVTFALNKAANDTYTESLRRGPIPQLFIPFVLRRARQQGTAFKFADFGANVGAVSLPLAAHGVHVLSIEAHPKNFMALATAARVNGLRNLRPVNMAAMDSAGLVALHGMSAWATAGVGGGNMLVPSDTLVDILQTYDFGDVDAIKIDIEGAELPALKGAETFFADRPEIEVIFESNNHTCHLFGYDRQDLLRWFVERGFSTYVFRPEGLMPVRVGDPQPMTVVDILATKRSDEALERQGETFIAMTDDYILQELLKICGSKHPHVRKHFLTEANNVSRRLENSPLWPRIAAAIGP